MSGLGDGYCRGVAHGKSAKDRSDFAHGAERRGEGLHMPHFRRSKLQGKRIAPEAASPNHKGVIEFPEILNMKLQAVIRTQMQVLKLAEVPQGGKPSPSRRLDLVRSSGV